MILSTKNTSRKNSTVIIDGVTVEFNEKSQTEVEQEVADQLMAADESLFIPGKEKEVKVPVVPPANKTDENDLDESLSDDTGNAGSSDPLAELKAMTKKDLQKLAADASLPVAEWEKLGQGKLVDYIASKLK